MLDDDRIHHRAHAIWVREGRPEGRHEDHWARACQELAAEEADDASAGTTLRHGSGAAGGDTGPIGGAGGAAAHHPGIGASMTDSPPRLGPAPVPLDDAGPGIADPGSPHGPSAGDRGMAPGAGTRSGRPAKGRAGAAGPSWDGSTGGITGRG